MFFLSLAKLNQNVVGWQSLKMIAQKSSSQCLKISQNVAFEKFSILAFFINFCFITLNCDLSGNTFLAIEWDFFCDFWTLWSLTFWPFSFETTLVVWMICCVVVCGNESKWCILMYLATSNDVIQCHRETRNVIRRILLAHSVWKWLKMSHFFWHFLSY